ncbi:hypothetical protein LEMLEM_LOCUS6700, partial [Lemmus lemmus]
MSAKLFLTLTFALPSWTLNPWNCPTKLEPSDNAETSRITRPKDLPCCEEPIGLQEDSCHFSLTSVTGPNL